MNAFFISLISASVFVFHIWLRHITGICVFFFDKSSPISCCRCNSNIGAMFFRPSMLSLGANCQIVSIATHELGHLLGFGHEQNRPDRDHYVDILWQNIAPGNGLSILHYITFYSIFLNQPLKCLLLVSCTNNSNNVNEVARICVHPNIQNIWTPTIRSMSRGGFYHIAL